jgi:CubicO group peptidase (beta-lactamase class C family)
MILEKVSGISYEALLKQRILEPLGMRDSGYDHFEDVLPHRASGYSGAPGPLRHAAYLDLSVPFSAGAMYSTTGDLLIWDRALHTDKVLPRAALDRMFTPVLNEYGYGWIIAKRFGRLTIGHGGGINGFSTFISRYPAERLLVVVLRNKEGTTGNVASDLAAIYFGEKYEIPQVRTPVTLAPEILDRYAGTYELKPGFNLVFRRKGNQLYTQATGQSEVPITAESETRFFLTVVDAQVEFFRDESGKVTHLILHQNGQQRAKRID